MVRLECTTAGHNKFWSIEIENEEETVVMFGSVGSKGRALHRDHGSADQATKYMENEIAKKKKQGYFETSSEQPSDDKSEDKSDTVEPATKKLKVEASFTRLEYENGGYKTKFWWIKVDGCRTEVGSGSMYPKEARPRISKKTHATPEEAVRFKDKMLSAKKKGGYTQVEPQIPPVDPSKIKLHVFGSEVSALELEVRNGDWASPGSLMGTPSDPDADLCRKDVSHSKMDDAPAAAKEVAEALRSAMPNLGSLPLHLEGFAGYSPEWVGGEVIVISSPGGDIKESCVAALAIQEEYLSSITHRAFVRYLEKDESWVPVDDGADAEVKDELTKGWKILTSKLKDVFRFAMFEPPRMKSSPVIWGGTSEDGSLVGVLGTRLVED